MMEPIVFVQLIEMLNELTSKRLPNGSWDVFRSFGGHSNGVAVRVRCYVGENDVQHSYTRTYDGHQLAVMGPDQWFAEIDELVTAAAKSVEEQSNDAVRR